jgi:hypothetical protein
VTTPSWSSTSTTATSPPSTTAPRHQPRDYFADPDASRPLDVAAEIDGFLDWAERTLGRAPAADDVRPLVAEDGAAVPTDDFVEDTAARLIGLLGLPLPPALAEVTG